MKDQVDLRIENLKEMLEEKGLDRVQLYMQQYFNDTPETDLLYREIYYNYLCVELNQQEKQNFAVF